MQQLNIREKILTILLILFAIIILFQRCNGSNCPSNPHSTKSSVVTVIKWKEKKEAVINSPKNTSNIISHKIPNLPEFRPTNNIDSCKLNFNKLLKDHLTKRIYQDTLKLDSIGTIIIIDTVQLNKLGKRTKIYDYKIPIVTKIITNTIIEKIEPVRQLYVGGNLFGDKTQLQLITPGVLYKDKKDRIYQANIGVNFNGTITYGLGAYWKIKLHK